MYEKDNKEAYRQTYSGLKKIKLGNTFSNFKGFKKKEGFLWRKISFGSSKRQTKKQHTERKGMEKLTLVCAPTTFQ